MTANEVRARFGHVFATGGIGPTHDDITSECVAAAGLPESRIAKGLAAIAARFPALDLGNYPYFRIDGNGEAIVAKGTDRAAATERTSCKSQTHFGHPSS